MQAHPRTEDSDDGQRDWLETTGAALGRLLIIAVPLVTLGLLVGFSYVTFSLLVTGKTAADSRGGQVLAVLDDHWRPLVAVALVIILLWFQQPIGRLLQRIKGLEGDLWGAKAKATLQEEFKDPPEPSGTDPKGKGGARCP